MEEHSPVAANSDAAKPQPGKHSNFFNRLIGWSILLAIIAVLFAMLFPVQRTARESSRRSQCKNNLKQIGLALHNYHEHWGAFPPPYTLDADEKPLHSWRTLILPFLDKKDLYDRIDLTKPWDDPVNADARNTLVHEFICLSNIHSQPHTCYVAIVGDEFAFSPLKPRKLSDFRDGLDNTVMIMEVPLKKTFEWMSPQDASGQDFLGINKDSKLSHVGGIHALLGNGSIKLLSQTLPEETRRALLTISGGEHIPEY